jgi:hypothetical protein
LCGTASDAANKLGRGQAVAPNSLVVGLDLTMRKRNDFLQVVRHGELRHDDARVGRW